ncbi:hypothetical protein SAMN05192533_11768 [Mesobacillus persicus]|uniref:Uncharacterized protein n=2 Tax=Mesobacillus persicus TaxID=930146 RepID=A0A1H8IK14_9BACI|nr:hypothetical protein SAMN05192533_11768 [Mesobacillus persicus]
MDHLGDLIQFVPLVGHPKGKVTINAIVELALINLEVTFIYLLLLALVLLVLLKFRHIPGMMKQLCFNASNWVSLLNNISSTTIFILVPVFKMFMINDISPDLGHVQIDIISKEL